MGRGEAIDRRELTEAQSFEQVRARLGAVANAAPPYVDPRALAMRALLVTDRLGQPDFLGKVHSLGRAGACDPASVEDLRLAARALLHVLSQLGEPYLSLRGGPRPQEALIAEALRLRRAGIETLGALDDDEARLWVEVFSLPFDDTDVVFDLRSLVRLYEAYGDVLGPASGVAARAARSCADALESGSGATPAEIEWRPWLARAFSLTASLYDDVCRIGRFVMPTGGAAVAFPSLPSIARARRRHGAHSQSHERAHAALDPPVAVAEPTVSEPTPAAASTPSIPVSPAPAPPASLPAAPVVAAPSEPEQAPPAPEVPAAGLEQTRDNQPTRGEHRFNVEIEVDVSSDSNFYVGFTENLSGGGLFVATYFLRPLGSKVEMCVRLPGRGDPLMLKGEVRWIREAAASDAWPGMGIRFEAMSEDDRTAIVGFVATRDPLFFVE